MKYTVEKMEERLKVLIDESIKMIYNLCNEDTLKDSEKVKKSLQQRCNTELKPQPVDKCIYDIFYKNFDPDSSVEAWKYYLKTYKNTFDESFELNTIKAPIKCPKKGDETVSFWYDYASYKRIYGTFLYSKPIKLLNLTTPDLVNGKNIGIGGDCCFNFNTNKFKKFMEIIITEEVRKILVLCSALHYSPINFALMPKNGGMNNIKGVGIQGLDRFDTFIASLDLFFKNKKNPIAIKLIAGFKASQNSLVPFLESIDSIEKYLELFYPELLTKNKNKNSLCKKLIKSGKEPIDSEDRVLEHIELAIRFWEAKLKYYNEKDLSKEI